MSNSIFESLEKRQLMSANLSGQEPGMLIIFGTLNSDTITVTKLTDGRVRVNDNGNFKTFAAGAVTSIWAVMSSGSDQLTIDSDLTIPTTLDGGNGDDKITGGSGNEVLLGGAGHDDLRGRNGNDQIEGDAGNDIIRGGNGDDELNGDVGKDVIYGGAGKDELNGGDNNDILVAVGGGQADNAVGGSGTDTFWIDSESTELVTSGSGERDLGLVHRISKFKDLNIHHGFLDDDTTTVSRNLNGQGLPDPLADGTYRDFSDHPLFASAGPTVTDIDQGGVGDCYFLASLAGVAKLNPNHIQRHMVDLGDGTYAVRFKGLFGEEYVRVDGDLPTKDSGALKYAKLGAEDSIWVAIMEKAWAFQRRNEGTYQSIDHGPVSEVFGALGLSANSSLRPFTRNELIDRIRTEMAAGRAMFISTIDNPSDNDSNMTGDHVYLVDRVNVDSAGNATSVRLYNPHGDFETVGCQELFDNSDGFAVGRLA